ncbi:hypothetical protein [Oceaniovalibus sp. ACAM 378]|uniref:hypothetical protein n=1 Tax=Oceaniovalibus sp. ACAM 378 TaxID=2599923 RepID=UPI0011D40A62|nr:hypothetical protein [Oceaniovalibus sp. ACAM 378]TYB86054.1 hypothetical protein FQ320_17350 [Oceaniovalibus sp. ACAM 378]
MKMMSIIDLASDSRYAISTKRNQLGSIADREEFEANLGALDACHHGIYAYVAFHPTTDDWIADFIVSSNIGSDAGKNILVLFLATTSNSAKMNDLERAQLEFGVDLVRDDHPAYEMAAQFFPSTETPMLPGLVFFESLVEPKFALYVPISKSDTDELTSKFRLILSLANSSLKNYSEEDPKLVFDRFAAKLISQGIDFKRADKSGVRGLALIGGAWVLRNISAIFAALPRFLDNIGKAKSLSESDDS